MIFGTVNADFGDQISATIIATGIKSGDITGNARTGFAATKKAKPAPQQQAPAFSGQPIHNGKVMEEQPEETSQQTSYVSEAEMEEIEHESTKINIPEFLLKSRRR